MRNILIIKFIYFYRSQHQTPPVLVHEKLQWMPWTTSLIHYEHQQALSGMCLQMCEKWMLLTILLKLYCILHRIITLIAIQHYSVTKLYTRVAKCFWQTPQLYLYMLEGNLSILLCRVILQGKRAEQNIHNLPYYFILCSAEVRTYWVESFNHQLLTFLLKRIPIFRVTLLGWELALQWWTGYVL